jgi:hypothetical protein
LASNPVNYVELDGHMALLDETGGKPLTGYGSGANTAAPVATSEESAAMLVAAASTLVSDGKAMCLGDGGYSFAGDFCQSLIKESLALRGRANLFAGGGSWSAAAQRWLNLSNTVLLAGAAGCGVFALATAGTGGMVCAAIYAGATATSAATTAIAATKIATRRGNALDNAGLFASTINAACLLSLKGEARRACVAISGTIGGIVSAATTAEDIRRIRAQQFREDR